MFDFIKKGFERTFGAINSAKKDKKITKDILEDMLLEADVAYEIIEEIIYYLPPQDEVKRADLKRVMSSYFIYENERKIADDKPFVDLILGVNGAGKTTTIAKLANLYKTSGKSVILGACDTFRAGAIEQLRQWSLKIDVPIVATQQGHDPSAVAFDTISSALAKDIDRVILDTAGRLQNQTNLANELSKIVRISSKAYEKAPHRKILILDGTQGNAGVAQAKAFNDIVRLDGVIITKLDGTPKGGALFGVARELELPILYIGVGESMNDLVKFNPDEFLDGLMDVIFG
ncbi:signal recognition particle-docking protein FtsY [Campylobacter sp. RM9344]|uniref:Signal recognition particle-docking protein FtsY n=1 Tax=Campylobacter californiensis TaxID=1032243 RepID=A0AAW3ZSX5_9BACT|nr:MULTISPECIES: signal recognition particle-docking protein FtsY [unclassified Campylobacter]MBE2985041.1 signal recognition particle-docking protein FtsY [Campylobacter sp. RM6883]MBE2987208.1 signal recognition particle-docking protein FtsY [Campylobacter sp. RM12919]MBE2988857.1 signal recognition particle-docking protein FtsY [Campylobacter sp. RM12920]MBE2995635.1 signal recognition particle-docking protein FtsY [Campylobacter sp. RM6913]MBE3029205.1 signal recognition particle-docking p